MDFRKAVIESLDRLVSSEVIDKQIEAALTKAISSVIADVFSTYGEFGKQLKAAVEKSLALNGELDLPSYNEQILKIIARQVESYTRDTIEKQVAANLTRLLSPPPAEITLEKLVESYKERLRDRARSGCVCYGDEHRIYLKVDRDRDIGGYCQISLSEEKPKGTYPQADIRISATGSGEVYGVFFKSCDVEKQIFAGPFYDFERFVFQMKAAKTKITGIDQAEYIDLDYSPRHD